VKTAATLLSRGRFGRGAQRCTVLVVCVAVSLGMSLSPVAVAARPPGPRLLSDPVAMETALGCPDGVSAHPDRPVVLLIPGTGSSGVENYEFGISKVLKAAGFDWCVVELPGRVTGDVQIPAEYVVQAVRTVHKLTGRKVSLVGTSQGAMEIRWAVRWWPDIPFRVEDLVTIVGANRGIAFSNVALCSSGECVPAAWQFASGSNFFKALNRAPMPKGPDYTAIYSLTDPLLQPAFPVARAVGSIDGASNIAVQDICPGRFVEHVQSIFDAAFAAVLVDALEHRGPGDAARVDRAVCAEVFAPEVNPVVARVGEGALYANAFASILTGPKTKAEPPVRPYAMGE
jgi:hypothetical protein